MSCDHTKMAGQSVTGCTSAWCKKRISWTAVLVGSVVGIGLSFLLNMFSLAIGLTLVSTTKDGAIAIAIGGFVGLLIGVIASMFVTGYTAGYLGRTFCSERNLGVLYGFTAWAIALILTIILAAPMSGYIAKYSAFVDNSMGSSVVVINNDATATSSELKASDSSVNADKSKTLATATFLIFVLFFVGALASCFGGHCGMCGCKSYEQEK